MQWEIKTNWWKDYSCLYKEVSNFNVLKTHNQTTKTAGKVGGVVAACCFM